MTSFVIFLSFYNLLNLVIALCTTERCRRYIILVHCLSFVFAVSISSNNILYTRKLVPYRIERQWWCTKETRMGLDCNNILYMRKLVPYRIERQWWCKSHGNKMGLD